MCDLIINSSDLLRVVIAASIAILTILISWGIFYLVMMLRNVLNVIKDVKTITHETKEAVLLFKEKAQSGTYLLKILSEGVKKSVDFVEEKVKKGQSKGKSKSTTKKRKVAKKK